MSIDLKGEQFGKLAVVGSKGKYRRARRWVCRCDCGAMTTVRHDHLTSGRIVSCGCFRAARTTSRNLRHGQSNSPEYQAWQGMIRRCNNPKASGYKYYGGKGIAVCAEWRRDFAAFLRDVGPRPTPKHSLEREKNDQPYCKKNCRWATKVEQANNKSNNVKVTISGKIMNVAQWKRELGLEGCALTGRVLRTVADYCSNPIWVRDVAVALSVEPEEIPS